VGEAVIMALNMYSKATFGTGKGATADTFDDLTAIQLRSDAKLLLGFWVLAVPETGIAAEAVSGQIRIQISDLGSGAQVYSCPPYGGGATASNVHLKTSHAEFLPMVKECKGKEMIEIGFSTNLPDPTNGCSVVVSAVYLAGNDNGKPASEVMQLFPDMAMIGCGADTEAAMVTAVGETAITDLVIPAWAKEIVGVKAFMIPDLMTAGEEICGFIRLRSSIPDFEPQEWPFVVGQSAPLGTPVGKGAEVQMCRAMAAFMQSTGKNETVTPYAVMNAAITTGNPVVCTVYYR
jgi:hypothetical protein